MIPVFAQPARSTSLLWTCLFGGFIFLDICSALSVIPIPDGDALFFYPIYLSVAHNSELNNPILSPITDGGGPLTWHGWLQPLLLGYLSKLFGAGLPGARVSESVVKTFGLLIYFVGIKRKKLDASLAAVLGAFIIYVSLTASQGRPELLAAVLLLTWHLADTECKETWSRTVIAAGSLGLLGVTQPTIAAISSILFVVILLRDYSSRRAFEIWLPANIGALAVVLLLGWLVYPHELISWIGGLLQHSAGIASRTDSDGLMRYWFLNLHRPLQGVVVIAAFAALGQAAVARGVRSSFFFSYCMAIILIWYTSVRIPALEYNAGAFVPLLVAIGVSSFTQKPQGRLNWIELCGYPVAAASVLAIIISSYSMLRGEDGKSILAHLKELRESGEAVIVLPRSILVSVVPFSDWDNYRIVETGEQCPAIVNSIVFVKQANSGRFVPPKLVNCHLMRDRFARPIEILGWDFPLVPKSYGYATYRATLPSSM